MSPEPDAPFASVVIPVWRDAAVLEQALSAVPPQPGVEVIAASVFGDDDEYTRIRAARPDVRWASAPRGRGVQMNAGAAAARGRWLVFLHADSRLPPEWKCVVRRADSRSGVVAGCFRLAFDSRDWRARVLEWGVRARIALFDLPYGDQAIFVRRAVFEEVGGYRDWPLMEDVDLVRRLKAAGRLWAASAVVVTSARRWERDGWLRQSAINMSLAVRFLLGASPARLAQRYLHRSRRAIVVMARAPWAGGKTRLTGLASEAALGDLRQALFEDTLDVARSLSDAQRIVACEPVAAAARFRGTAGAAIEVMPQRGDDLGERMRHVFEDAFRLGAELVVIIGSDLPDLPERLLTGAFAALDADPARVVLGPAEDGGYYLIGMCAPRPGLFAGIEWGTSRVVEATVAAAARDGVPVVLLERWGDVDQPQDIAGLLARRGGGAAPRTRRWIEAHRGPA